MKDWGIKTRMLVLALIPATVIALLLAGYYTFTRIQDLDLSLEERGEVIARQLAPASEYGVFSGNTDFLFSLANATIEESDVRCVSVRDSSGRALARSGPSMSPHGTVPPRQDGEVSVVATDDGLGLVFTAPIYQTQVIVDDFGEPSGPGIGSDGHSRKSIGSVQVELSRSSTLLKKNQVLRNSALITCIVLLGSLALAMRVMRQVSVPIVRLTKAVQRLEEGDLETRVETQSGGELGTLEQGFNMMASTVQSARDDLREQVEQATRELREALDTMEVQNAVLAMAKKEALAASKVKSEFLANMSHEIRTPLNGILGYANLTLRTSLDDTQKEYVSSVRSSANALLEIVNDILDFSRIEADRLELEAVDFSLRECVEDVLDLLAPSAREKGLELVYFLYADVPATVRGDPTRLRQVLVNLFSNGVKFTDSGSVVIRVMLEEISSDHVMLAFTVTDTGVGLTEQQRMRLFRAFTQADSSPRRRVGGSGLGLVISKKLVEKMQGKITLDSQPRGGTTVSFTVRFQPAERREADTTAVPLLEGRRVLFYEPHPMARLALREAMTRWGMVVEDTGDAARLLDLVRNGTSFRAAVLGLPLQEPIDDRMLDAVREAGSRLGCPVVLLTGRGEPECHELLGDSITALCLLKPVRHGRLRHALLKVLTDRSDPDAAPAPGRVVVAAAPPSLAGTRLLVVEDNRINRQLLVALLEHTGAEIEVAEDGRRALEQIAVKPFDLILMDVHMPDMDGMTVTSLLRSAERGSRRTPVVALTADAMEGSRERFLEAGMDDYLPKPIDENALYEILERWITQPAGPGSGHHSPPVEPVAQDGAPPARAPVLDREAALRTTAGRQELATELLSMLMADLPSQQTRLKAALRVGNFAEAAHVAHTIAGGAAHCGARAMAAAAKSMEAAADAADREQAEHCLQTISTELHRLSEAVAGAGKPASGSGLRPGT